MRNVMTKFATTVSLIFVLFTGISSADVLIIERIQNSKSINVPDRGLSMDQVIAEFGEPIVRKESIGSPPITVWKYNDFSVYFEKTWVINSVVNKASSEEKGPKPVTNY